MLTESCDQKSGGNTCKSRRRRNSDQNEVVTTIQKEDLENKGNKKRTNNRGTKKKILEEANNSKLRDVQVRVEDCLETNKFPVLEAREEGEVPAVLSEGSDKDESVVKDTHGNSDDSDNNGKNLKGEKSPQRSFNSNTSELLKGVAIESKSEVHSKQERTFTADPKKIAEVFYKRTVKSGIIKSAEINRDKPNDNVTRGCCSNSIVLNSSHDEAGPPVITSAPECNSVDDDGPLSRSSPFKMDDAAGTAVSRFPDDRSDSGVSSFRSGSGDERSGSRSSALSISDEPQSQSLQTTTTQPTNRSPLFIPTNTSHNNDKPSSEPVRVWRDPSLAAEPRVRHVQSVQHQTLLMSHPPPASAPQPPSNNSAPSVSQAQQALALVQAQTAHYPPVPPPPLLSPHPLHVPLPPPGLYSQLPEVLWKQRYPPLPVAPHLLGPTHTSAEELLERERAFFQDKDRLLR